MAQFDQRGQQIGRDQFNVGGDLNIYQPPDEPQINLEEAEATYRQQVVALYNQLNFSGFEYGDPSLVDVPLENIFVRLTLTVEKTILEPIPPEELNGKERREGRKRERKITVQEPVELAQALSQHLLIEGEPGAGKSTLLRWLAVTFAQRRQREFDRLGHLADKDRLPVFIELGHLPERYLKGDGGERPNWIQFLPEYLTKQQMAFTSVPSQLLAQALAAGRCLLLFDGLDEVANHQARGRLAQSLAQLARLFPGNRIVIGSRPAGVSESRSTLHRPLFQFCQIERFTPEDIRQFFRFWYALHHDLTPEQQRYDADALYARVQATPATLQLASTPLFSTILVLIWCNEGDLPERRVELYERCCRVLIERWEASHDVAYQGALAGMDWGDHLRLLTPLAYTIHSQEQRTKATKEELVPLLAQALLTAKYSNEQVAATREAKQFLATLGLRSGLLQDMGDDTYGFPHQTFQEYLAARYIAAQPDPEYIDLVMAHLHEAWWQEVHLLTIAHLGSGSAEASKASTLILTILHVYAPPSRIWRPFYVPPSRRTLRSSRDGRTLRYPRRDYWLHLIEPGKLLPQVQLERRIAWVLGREFELATKAMVGTVFSAQAVSLMRYIIYGRNYEEEEEEEEEMEILLDVTWQMLERSGNEIVVSALMAALRDDAKTSVRVHAAWRLDSVRAGNEIVVNALLQALRDDAEPSVRASAAASLGQVGAGNPAVVSALLAALHDDETVHDTSLYHRFAEHPFPGIRESSVQASAATSLGQLGAGNPAVVSALLTALRDRDDKVRASAAESLGQVGAGNAAVVSALLEVLRDNTGKSMRETVATSLGQLGAGNPAVVSALLEVLRDDEDWSVRETVATSLGQLGAGNPAVVNVLLKVLFDDEDRDMRETVATSLGQVGAGNAAVVSALLEVLRDDADPDVQVSAAASLGQLRVGNAAVVSALLTALHSHVYPSMGRRVAKSLSQLGAGNAAVISTLLEVLRDDADWFMRKTAAASLGYVNVGNIAVVSALLAALRDDADPSVRASAAASLGLVGAGSEAAVRALLVALCNDADWSVRRYAAASLGQMGAGNAAVISALLEVLRDDADWFMRKTAAASLGQVGVGNAAVVSALLKALHDEANPLVQWMAAASLGQMGAGNAAVISALSEVLRDDADPFMRQGAAASLSQMGAGNVAVISALSEVLRDDADPSVRATAAASLGQMGAGNPAVVSALLEVLRDKSWPDGAHWPEGWIASSFMRASAAESLGLVGAGNAAVVSTLLEVLHDDAEPRVRASVVGSLGQLGAGNMAVVNALLQALRDEIDQSLRKPSGALEATNADVRASAATSLGQVGAGNPAVVSALLKALRDRDDEVRASATKSLGHLEIKNTIQLHQVLVALNRCLHDRDWYVGNGDEVYEAALASIHQLLDGRPIPGYQWMPLRKRREWRRQLKRIAIWLGMIAVIVMVGLIATWLLGALNSNSFLVRFLAVLSGIVASVAAVAQVLGQVLRDPWEHSRNEFFKFLVKRFEIPPPQKQ